MKRRWWRRWSDHSDWYALTDNLGYLAADQGIHFRIRQIMGGKRWSLAVTYRMTTAEETRLATSHNGPGETP